MQIGMRLWMPQRIKQREESKLNNKRTNWRDKPTIWDVIDHYKTL